MKLIDLEPTFLRYEIRTERWTRHRADGIDEEITGPRSYFVRVTTLAEAQGIKFRCPKCGDHAVICWSRSRGTPDDATPGPGRWALVGTSLEDLTLNADPPSQARSVLLSGGCARHGFVTNGEVTSA